MLFDHARVTCKTTRQTFTCMSKAALDRAAAAPHDAEFPVTFVRPLGSKMMFWELQSPPPTPFALLSIRWSSRIRNTPSAFDPFNKIPPPCFEAEFRVTLRATDIRLTVESPATTSPPVSSTRIICELPVQAQCKHRHGHR